MPLTMLCIATYHKGGDFLDECHRQGCRVLLLTEEKLRDADWPRHAIDGFYYVRRDMPGGTSGRALPISPAPNTSIASSPSTISTSRPPPCCASTCTCPGWARRRRGGFGTSSAMRSRARSAGIRCPEFVHAVNDAALAQWTARIGPPWVLKPRSQAAAIGIRTINAADELWEVLHALGDARADYVLEQFVAGDVYHVDSLVFDRRVVFATPSHYGTPPMAVAHGGGIFVTHTLEDADARAKTAEEEERAGPRLVRPATRRLAHGVHPRPGRRGLLSRDVGARRRRLHRRRRRSRDGGQPLA